MTMYHFGTLRFLGIGFFAMLLIAFVPLDGAGQHFIEGRVLDDVSEEAIPGVEVVLMDGRGRDIARWVTNDEGSFEFMIQRPGSVRLRANRIGYRETTTPALRVEEGESYQVEIRLDTEAVLIAPLEVVGRTRSQTPVMDNFFHRKRVGLGHFITRDDIRERSPFAITDLLANVPGVRVTSAGRGGTTRRNISMGRALPGEGDCPVQVYLDGTLVNRRNLRSVDPTGDGIGRDAYELRSDNEFSIDDVVSVMSIEGIEVYRGISTVPAEFSSPDARCGVVAIWTRVP